MSLVVVVIAGLLFMGRVDPWLLWPLSYGAVIWAPGWGWARWLERSRPSSRLGRGLHAAWLGAAMTWIDVAVVRELGISEDAHALALLGLAAVWAATGDWIARKCPRAAPNHKLERLGMTAVLLSVVAIACWRWGDVTRPLDGYWALEDAAEEGHEAQPITAEGRTDYGWEEAGAFSVKPENGTAVLTAESAVNGRVVLAIRGPLGSRVALGDTSSVVEAAMTEVAEEGPVRRYLRHGVAAIAVPLALEAGESVTIEATGDQLYVLPGTEAVWALHAEGELRYVHRYQLLNQVENQVWAEELLRTRRLTLHQPPGWSPLLSTATVFLVPDMQAGTTLFLMVILWVGMSAVRLGVVLAPHAPPVSMLVPAGMVASHGLLMFEPGSTNFPDSLYAAAVLAVATAIASGRSGWVAGLGMAAGLLRWPGVVLSTMLVLGWWLCTRTNPLPALKRMWALVGLGALIALAGIATGDIVDLGFILYFETFPEHWHGNYAIGDLLSRVPGFYGLWAQYTGGGLILAALCMIGRQSETRAHLRFILGTILAYSLMLCTIDHHPTHYFLPLVAATGVAIVTASANGTNKWFRNGLPALCLVGLWAFLWMGQT